MMSFTTAVRTVLSEYATFSGRARRSEYWWWYLFFVLVLAATTVIDGATGAEPVPGSTAGWVTTLVALALMLPHLAVGARRLHDIGRSGWWLLIVLVPVVGVVAL
ncbi:MAG TPA: DUF805 domain-containing protein, partial [Ornithinibacter sp.]|nr:DUF805 domain-containing protein [Ornithinibacter sp.]